MPGATKAQRAATAERRAKAIAMKLAGATFEQIAETLKYASRGAACTDIQRALEQSLAEQHRDAEVLRHELVLSLSRVKAAMWPAAMRGDTKAADVAIRCIEKIARLTVPDQPTRVELLTMGTIEAAIADLERQLGEVPSDRSRPVEFVGGAEAGPPA